MTLSKSRPSLKSVPAKPAAVGVVICFLLVPLLVRAQQEEGVVEIASNKTDVPAISTGPASGGERQPESGRGLSVDGLIDVIKSGGGASLGEGVDKSVNPTEVKEPNQVVSKMSPPVDSSGGSEDESSALPADSYDIPFLTEEGDGRVPLLRLNASSDRVANEQTESEGLAAPSVSAVDAAGGLKEGEAVRMPEAGGGLVREEVRSELPVVEQSSGVREEGMAWTSQEDNAGAYQGYRVTPVGRQEKVRFARGAGGETASGQSVETWMDGYFPTSNDNFYLGDHDYPRQQSIGERWIQPDSRAQLATGIGAFGEQDPTFFDEHDYIFGPLDDGLGFLADHQALAWESARPQYVDFAIDGDLPMFTREFEPDKAHVKAGPLYMDLLSIGAGVLYSDYEGLENFREGEEDGWLSYAELHMRALFQVSNNFYIAASGRMVYLPGSNRVAFRLGNGFGPNVLARLNYQARVNDWDLLVYDEVRARSYGDLFDSGAIERAGRYSFGFTDAYRGRDYFDNEVFHLANEAGAKASRLLNPDWRLSAAIDRTDTWQTHDLDNHATRHHAGLLVGYEGSDIPFSPYASYDVDTVDDFDSFFHRNYIGGRGRITENLSLDARGGLLWTTGRSPDQERWLWSVGLKHDLSERTHHSVWFGQDFFIDDFTNEVLATDYLRYQIGHRVTKKVYARAFVQLSDDEYLEGREEFNGQNQLYGANLNVRPGDYTNVLAGAAYQRRDFHEERDWERMLYFLQVNQQIMSRTTLWFKYQFEEAELFDEHLYSTGIRKYF